MAQLPLTEQGYRQYIRDNFNWVEKANSVISPSTDLLDINNRYLIKLIQTMEGLQTGGTTDEVVLPDTPEPEFGYQVKWFDLNTAKPAEDPEEIKVPGNSIAIYTDGDLGLVQYAIDDKTAGWIMAGEMGNPLVCKRKFNRIYLSWTAQPNKYMRVYIGTNAEAWVAQEFGIHLGKMDATNPLAPTFATVTNVSSEIVASNSNRKTLTVVNDSDTVIYIAQGNPAVVGRGIRLNALGAGYSINWMNFYSGSFYAIHDAGAVNKNMSIQECE